MRLAAEKAERDAKPTRAVDVERVKEFSSRCKTKPAVCHQLKEQRREHEARVQAAEERRAKYFATKRGQSFAKRCKTKVAVCWQGRN